MRLVTLQCYQLSRPLSRSRLTDKSTKRGQIIIVSFMVLKMLMLFSICEKAFGRIGKKIEKNKLPKERDPQNVDLLAVLNP